MSQSRPSPPSRPSREESQDPSPAPGAPSSPSADPAASPAGRAVSAIPSHQSRPGPEDDTILPTNKVVENWYINDVKQEYETDAKMFYTVKA